VAKSKKRKYISYAARIIVAAGALYFAFRGEDFSKIANLLLGLSPWIILLVVAAWFASQLLFVTRWRLLLTVQSVHIGYWVAFRLHLLGIFYNNCLPSAVGGDFLRAWYVTTHTDKRLEAALSVFVDRFVGLSGMVIMAVTGYWLVPVQTPSAGLSFRFELGSTLAKYWPVLAAGVLLPVALVAVAAITIKGRAFLVKCAAWVRQHGIILINRTRKAVLIYWGHKIALLLAYVLTFLCQGVFILGLVFVGRSIGMAVPARYYFVFLPVAWVVGALPVSVGGLGIWEGALIFLFVAAGASTEHASALALCHRALWLFGSLPGVIIHLAGAHLPKQFSVDDNDRPG
jgi:uncharacterized protein (TIRG00374 family)